MPTIKLLKRAELELNDACDWYEKQQKGLSLRFRNAVESSLESISLNPNLYPKKYGTYLHFAPIRKFPYLIIYRHDTQMNEIVVTSIFHTKRNPGKFEFE